MPNETYDHKRVRQFWEQVGLGSTEQDLSHAAGPIELLRTMQDAEVVAALMGVHTSAVAGAQRVEAIRQSIVAEVQLRISRRAGEYGKALAEASAEAAAQASALVRATEAFREATS
jgi:hypothetical protein